MTWRIRDKWLLFLFLCSVAENVRVLGIARRLPNSKQAFLFEAVKKR
jgi:hypothetical protein